MIFIRRIFGEKEVRVYDLDILGLFPLSAPSPVCLDAEEIHHPFDRLSIHCKVQGDTSRPVRRMLAKSLFDKALQSPVTIRAKRVVVEDAAIHPELSGP